MWITMDNTNINSTLKEKLVNTVAIIAMTTVISLLSFLYIQTSQISNSMARLETQMTEHVVREIDRQSIEIQAIHREIRLNRELTQEHTWRIIELERCYERIVQQN